MRQEGGIPCKQEKFLPQSEIRTGGDGGRECKEVVDTECHVIRKRMLPEEETSGGNWAVALYCEAFGKKSISLRGRQK